MCARAISCILVEALQIGLIHVMSFEASSFPRGIMLIAVAALTG